MVSRDVVTSGHTIKDIYDKKSKTIGKIADYVIVGIFNGYYKLSPNLVQTKYTRFSLNCNITTFNDMLDGLQASKSHSTAR